MTERDHSHDCARTGGEQAQSADVVMLRTSGLDTAEGRDEWRNTLGSLYCEMDVAWPKGNGLDAEWGGRPFGDLHVSSIRCEEQTVIRSPAMIRSDPTEDFLVCLITDGSVEVTQAGRATLLRPGGFAFLELGEPFVFHSPDTFRQVVVRVPGRMMSGRLPNSYAHRFTAREFAPTSGPAGIVGTLLTQIANADAPIPRAASTSFATSVVDMLTTTIMAELPAEHRKESFRSQDLARIQQVIADNLHDADFSLSDLAAQAGMSARNVQKLVATTGNSPMAWLYAARIERAKHLLMSTGQSVAEVSECVGFRDVSHFSRMFRKQVGVSPGRYRRVGVNRPSADEAVPSAGRSRRRSVPPASISTTRAPADESSDATIDPADPAPTTT